MGVSVLEQIMPDRTWEDRTTECTQCPQLRGPDT